MGRLNVRFPQGKPHCSEIWLAWKVRTLCSSWVASLAMLVADCNHFVDESVLAEKSARWLTNQAGSVHLMLRRKTARTAADFREFGRQVLQTAVQHQIHVCRVLQVRDQYVFLGQCLEVSCQFAASVGAAATSLQHVPLASQFVRRPFPSRTAWRLVRYQMGSVLV